VLNSLTNIKQQKQSNINNDRSRLNESIDALKEANTEIDSASRRMQEINGSMLLDFQGIFDSDYNRKFQNSRIANAKTKLFAKTQVLQQEKLRDDLDLQEANLDFNMYKQALGIQTSKANLSAVQANAIIQSNAARTQMRKILQQKYTDVD